jgi:HK97 family phage major capsid protein
MEPFDQETLKAVAEVLQKQFGFATTTQLDNAVLEIVQRSIARQHDRKNTFSLSTMIRGLRAMKGEPIQTDGRGVPITTTDADVNYVKALTTGATPGSYLVPTIQADEIIHFLETGGIARAAGVRVWPMNGIQKMNVPTATGAPAWMWMAQNSVQTATDPNLGQMAFDLKERRALIAVPNQLLAVSVPAFDTLLSELLGLGAAAHEDTAFFATSTVAGGPTALMSASSISTILAANGSANGGNLTYLDILATMAKLAAVKARPPFVWFASPRTMYQRILGLLDLQSRPIYLPTLTGMLEAPRTGSQQVPVGMLMGYPVYVSPYILENEANGSGTNQSHLIITNPTYAHIAQDGNIEIAVSLERFFDANQTAIRAIQHEDFGYAPPAGIVVLLGIN